MSELDNSKQERLLKADDISNILNISRALTYRLIQQGSIPVVRINHAVRVKPSDLEAYIASCRKELGATKAD
jgi:excisionase family DNA binding protein